jgi:hypothetical protein
MNDGHSGTSVEGECGLSVLVLRIGRILVIVPYRTRDATRFRSCRFR